MDREFLKKYNLMEAHNQFMRLCNEGYLSTSLQEAGDEEAPIGPDQNNAPAPDGGEPMNDMPPMDGPANPPAPNNEGDGQETPEGEDNMTPPEDMPMPPMDNDNMPPAEEPEEENDVIDVEDMVQAQEKLNNKSNEIGQDLGNLDSRIANLMTAVEKMKGIIDHNNSEITSLKAELEKRIPTQTERLNMRSLDSYPFNVNPTDYWKDKEEKGGYAAKYDNNQPEKKEYIIKPEDVNNYSETDVANSFDDELRQTMKDIFKGF